MSSAFFHHRTFLVSCTLPIVTSCFGNLAPSDIPYLLNILPADLCHVVPLFGDYAYLHLRKNLDQHLCIHSLKSCNYGQKQSANDGCKECSTPAVDGSICEEVCLYSWHVQRCSESNCKASNEARERYEEKGSQICPSLVVALFQWYYV